MRENRAIFLALVLVFLVQVSINAETVIVPNVGRYANIDTTKDTEILTRLKSSDEKTFVSAMNEVGDNLDKFGPVVTCFAAHELFTSGYPYEGLKMYLIGRLRVTYDILRCTDPSVGDTRQVIDGMFVPDFMDYIKAHEEEYKRANIEAIDYFESHEELYEHRWINLRGLRGMGESLGNPENPEPLSKPESEWPEIKKRIVENFRKTFPKKEG